MPPPERNVTSAPIRKSSRSNARFEVGQDIRLNEATVGTERRRMRQGGPPLHPIAHRHSIRRSVDRTFRLPIITRPIAEIPPRKDTIRPIDRHAAVRQALRPDRRDVERGRESWRTAASAGGLNGAPFTMFAPLLLERRSSSSRNRLRANAWVQLEIASLDTGTLREATVGEPALRSRCRGPTKRHADEARS